MNSPEAIRAAEAICKEIIAWNLNVQDCAAIIDREISPEIERLKYFISQVGFYLAASEFHHVSDMTLRILAGESLQDIRKSITIKIEAKKP